MRNFFKEKKNRILQAACLLAVAVLVIFLGKNGLSAEEIDQPSWRILRAEVTEDGVRVETAGQNLMLGSGVRVKADSAEGSAFRAEAVRDGVSDETDLRWSSENDWEDNEHWLSVRFSETVTVGLVRVYWERNNALEYSLEYSSDGKKWEQAASFSERPEDTVQDILLEEPIQAGYLRLHVTAVAKEEADLSLYYQNVSVLELEVYEGIEDVFLVEKPEIPPGSRRQLMAGQDGTESAGQEDAALSQLADASGSYQPADMEIPYPAAPEGYSLEFAGADYEMLVDAEGRIADTLSPVEVELGFALVKDGERQELPGMKVTIPASGSADATLPEDYSCMEWQPSGGTYTLSDRTRIVVPKRHREEVQDVAELFAKELSEALGREVELIWAEDSGEMERDDIYLSFLEDRDGNRESDWIDGLGGEGYELDLQSASEGGFRIYGRTAQGVRWGCVSFLELLEKTGGELPGGKIRDYPRYPVRGFGIDVGRRPVSMELLYEIVEELSAQKMNTLQVHLNDNQIISQSGYDGTLAGAKSLYAGFRLESDVKNEAGEGITSTDVFYTKEEFAQFIEDAAAYGVEVVPEIDTPAHSLALTKVFPKLGLSGDPEGADQLDLSQKEAVQLGKDLWSEYLTEGVFENCRAVHIGMDEYFGDGKDYISYLTELSTHVQSLAPDKKIRIWGSLSKITEDHSGVSRNLQMHIWDTDWADPQDMYEEGFSIINSLSSSLYIIPGGGYDWLDEDFLEKEWQPNVFRTAERTWMLPAYSDRMLGACYMLWNDWWQEDGEEITEADLLSRIVKPLPAIAQKLWGSAGE